MKDIEQVYSPKEKATELVNKYWEDIPDVFFEEAVECALIAINELIEHLQPASDFGGEINKYTIEYWEEVKQEANKL
jgi:hypothetical protein